MLLLYAALLVPLAFILMLIRLIQDRRDRGAVFTFVTALSLSEFLYFVLMFIAKHRGFDARMEIIFFLTRGIDAQLRYHIILLNQLGFGIALGRCLFPYFLLCWTVEIVAWLSRRRTRMICLGASVLPVLTLIGYSRPVFEWITALSPVLQKFFVQFSFAWCVAYTLLAVAISLSDVFRTSIRLLRYRHLQWVAIILGFAGIYLLYCRQDPAQAYMFYQDTYMHSLGLWYLSPVMRFPTQLAVLILLLLCTATSTVYMIRVGLWHIRARQEDRTIRQQFNMARHGGNIFVHGIKNQLLSCQAVCRKMEAEARQAQPDLEKLRAEVRRLQDGIDGMTEHVNQLYRSFREPKLLLAATDSRTVIDEAVQLLIKRYPQALVEQTAERNYELMADKAYLSEALCNLLLNGWEAVIAAGRQDQPLRVCCYRSQHYAVIEIADRGNGIPKARQRQIFEPFYTEKNTNQNWGMGLYLSRRIIRQHFGQLEIASQVGEGTVQYVLLPLMNAARPGKEETV
ncbi:MAG: hypothetical protein IJ662_00100 [Clostridia bacterium]|nr:hypothetical protein [Clostridia bacterium]